jgi:sugar lactone lactonase YvrE
MATSQDKDAQGEPRVDFSQLGRGQRWMLFIVFIIGGVMLIVGLFLFLAISALDSGPRVTGRALVPAVSIREFAALPSERAYPATVAVAADGTVYTGSYADGTLWRIDPQGVVQEIPDSRSVIGSVVGLAVAADGALLIVDQGDSDPRAAGGMVQQLNPDGTITPLARPSTGNFVEPEDITSDAQGRIYVADRGNGQIWRFERDGSNATLWWQAPTPTNGTLPAPNGLAYAALNDAILVTDSNSNTVTRIAVADASTTIIYSYGVMSDLAPGLDGIVQLDDGRIYAAALAQNGLVQIIPATDATPNGRLLYLVGELRGPSDVAAIGTTLYVTNFDQRSLVLPVSPQLPFALDVVTLPADDLALTPTP